MALWIETLSIPNTVMIVIMLTQNTLAYFENVSVTKKTVLYYRPRASVFYVQNNIKAMLESLTKGAFTLAICAAKTCFKNACDCDNCSTCYNNLGTLGQYNISRLLIWTAENPQNRPLSICPY